MNNFAELFIIFLAVLGGCGTNDNMRFAFLDFFQDSEITVNTIFRMAIFHLLDLGNVYYKRFDPANAAITSFKITKENGIQMVCFNDTGHLEGMETGVKGV